MTAAGRARLARLGVWGVLLFLPAGWAASGALAEEAPVPTVPVPTTVAPDPVPPPAVSEPQPDPAPRPRATTRPARAPTPRASNQRSVVNPSRVEPRAATQDPRAVRLAELKAAAKAKAAKAKAKKAKAAKAAAAKANARPSAGVAGVARVASASSRLAQRTVTVESVRTEDQLFASGIAFLAGLLIPVGLVAAVVLIRRKRPRASGTTSLTYIPAPRSRHLVRAAESRPQSPQPAVMETGKQPPVAEHEEPPPSEPEAAPVAEPIKVAAEEWAGWEFCEIDWWRGYVKSYFFAKATTPGEPDYVVRESSMFRWRGNGVPDATPAITAAHKQLIERLRAEGWEDDPGTSANWYAQTFRRRRDPEALPR